MTRRQRSTRHLDLHPTYSRILDEAIHVIEDDGFDLFNVQKVLEKADVSRATLYRYFPDVDSLIEEALVHLFSRETRINQAVIEGLVENSTDLNSFRIALRKFLAELSNLPKEVRVRRAHIIALTATRPQLAISVAAVQEELTRRWEDSLQLGQRRGFVRADLDARAIAVMFQSISLGRIADEASINPLANQRWADSFFEYIDQMVLVRPE